MTIQKKEFVVLIGGNGAGKSTTLNLISGRILPDSGNVIIDGQDVTYLPSSKRAQWVANVLQDPRKGTFENMSILENMAFAFKRGQKRGFLPFSNRQRKAFFVDKLAQLGMGLEQRLDEPVNYLSGGQRQALSLVMASLSQAKILLLDEITAALDPNTSSAIMSLTAQIVKETQCTCMMITHNMMHAIHYGDRLLLLNQGAVAKEYSGAEKSALTVAELTTMLASCEFSAA